jgi:predicted nucleic acid-binding Zn ribbon protein
MTDTTIRPRLLPPHLRGKTVAPIEPLRLPLRNCLYCQQPFQPESSDRQYCSMACVRLRLIYERNHEPVMQRVCVVCGTQFEATQKSRQRTCSLECSREDPARVLMQRVCVVCGTQFEAGSYKKTCSPTCFFKHQHPPPKQSPPIPTRRCVVCGALYRSRRRLKLTCSLVCSNKRQRQRTPSQQQKNARAALMDLQRMALQEARAAGLVAPASAIHRERRAQLLRDIIPVLRQIGVDIPTPSGRITSHQRKGNSR